MQAISARNEDQAVYGVSLSSADDSIIAQALDILFARVKQGEVMSSPASVKHWLQLKIGGYEHEVFGIMFLDVQNRLIRFEEMFRGTLTQTSVYPREVVKAAIQCHAAAVVLTHNHPSGSTQPSRADEALTQTLKAALALVDVRVLDHIIVSQLGALSMAEKGLV